MQFDLLLMTRLLENASLVLDEALKGVLGDFCIIVDIELHESVGIRCKDKNDIG